MLYTIYRAGVEGHSPIRLCKALEKFPVVTVHFDFFDML